MKRILSGKQLITLLLTMGFAVGCTSSPKESAPPTAEQVSQAITDAKAAIAEAEGLNWVWRDTGTFVLAAEGTAETDPEGALKLANKARSQAEMAVNQYYLEQSKVMLDRVSASQGTASQQDSTLAAADAAIRNAEGRKAYDMLAPLAR